MEELLEDMLETIVQDLHNLNNRLRNFKNEEPMMIEYEQSNIIDVITDFNKKKEQFKELMDLDELERLNIKALRIAWKDIKEEEALEVLVEADNLIEEYELYI